MLFVRKIQLIGFTDSEYIFLFAPVTGIVVSSIILVSKKYCEPIVTKQFKRLKNSINNTNKIAIRSYARRLFSKIPLKINSKITISKITIVINKFLAISIVNITIRIIYQITFVIYQIIKLILIFRSVRLIASILTYSLTNQANILNIIINSLYWNIFKTNRKLVVQLTYILVSSLTAGIWLQFPVSRKVIATYTLVTILNCPLWIPPAYVRKTDDIGTFGLPVIERPVHQLSPAIEQLRIPSTRISIPEKENEFILSVTPDREMLKEIYQDVEISEVMKSSVLGEAEILSEAKILVNKSKGPQKGKFRKTNQPFKPKPRTNNLKKLNSNYKNINSYPVSTEFETDVNDLHESKKIREDRLK